MQALRRIPPRRLGPFHAGWRLEMSRVPNLDVAVLLFDSEFAFWLRIMPANDARQFCSAAVPWALPGPKSSDVSKTASRKVKCQLHASKRHGLDN